MLVVEKVPSLVAKAQFDDDGGLDPTVDELIYRLDRGKLARHQDGDVEGSTAFLAGGRAGLRLLLTDQLGRVARVADWVWAPWQHSVCEVLRELDMEGVLDPMSERPAQEVFDQPVKSSFNCGHGVRHFETT